MNGESGIAVWGNCGKCGRDIQLCSNDLTDEQIKERCNGEACGCGDRDDWICEDCY